MKNIPKILKTIFLIIFIFQMVGLIFLLATPNLTQAIEFKPQVEIPGFSEEAKKSGMTENDGGYKITDQSIGIYIKAIYKYAIGIVGILAAIVLMMAGVIWLTAGGNQTRIGEAKAWIGASLTGLIIALASYMILFTVNPDLVNFQPIKLKTVKEIIKNPIQNGCCDGACSTITKQDECKDGNTWEEGVHVCSENKCADLSERGCCLYDKMWIGNNYKKCDFNTVTENECITQFCPGNPDDCSFEEEMTCWNSGSSFQCTSH